MLSDLCTLYVCIVVDNVRIIVLCFLFQIQPEMLDTLYKYAKFQYECGNYSGAAEYLYFYRVLVSIQVTATKHL